MCGSSVTEEDRLAPVFDRGFPVGLWANAEAETRGALMALGPRKFPPPLSEDFSFNVEEILNTEGAAPRLRRIQEACGSVPFGRFQR